MAQKILMLKDHEHVGKKGEVASVKTGFAYNYLIPQKIAVVADKSALRHQARLREERRQQAAVELQEAQAIAGKINGIVLDIAVKVDHEGHLYGSVSALDIVKLLQQTTGVEVEKRAIQLKHAIKEVGVFDISVRLKEDVEAQLQVKVIAETE